jgi:8-amino-7-oxononanoate synthase
MSQDSRDALDGDAKRAADEFAARSASTRHSPLEWLSAAVDGLHDSGLYREQRTRCSPQGAHIDVNGRRLLNFGSNDYLGLAAESSSQSVVEMRGEMMTERMISGSGSSPAIQGRSVQHEQLERSLAEFEGCEAALLFPTGYAANVGTISALVSDGDLVLSDAKNHASIIDGCRLSAARVAIYRHGDVTHLAELLADARTFRRRLIVTDSLFSMDGDFAPLADIADLAEKFDAMLMIDEAHASGVWGDHGRGVAELAGVEGAIDIRVGTLSKAFGALGGFVSGSQPLVTWLRHRARSYFFSTALPDSQVQLALNNLRKSIAEPNRRRSVSQIASNIRERLVVLGWSTGTSKSQIIPIYLGETSAAMQAMQRLADAGIFAPAIRPPSVPPGESLVRLSCSALHSDEMVERLCEALGGAG